MINLLSFKGNRFLLENYIFNIVKKNFFIIFSGGNSNSILLDVFNKKKISNKKIILSDERVNVDAKNTNLYNLKECSQVYRYNQIFNINKKITIPVVPKKKAAFVGFAKDGHFASFFQNKQYGVQSYKLYVPVFCKENIYPERLNLNINFLTKMDEIYFLKKDKNSHSLQNYKKLLTNDNFIFLKKKFKQINFLFY